MLPIRVFTVTTWKEPRWETSSEMNALGAALGPARLEVAGAEGGVCVSRWNRSCTGGAP